MSADFEAGAFLVDKPAGASSFYMVRKVRNALGIKKVGHAGTLDPFATGLLVICAGRAATKLIGQIQDGEKEYLATLRLGRETTTLDPEGDICNESPVGLLEESAVTDVLQGFQGTLEQTPPIYSALKHKGKPLYHYARKGIEVTKPPRTVTIDLLERIESFGDISDDNPFLSIRVVCSKGTYIRTLGADIGKALGCGAYLTSLRRIRSGCFHIHGSVAGSSLEGENARQELLKNVLSVPDLLNLLQ